MHPSALETSKLVTEVVTLDGTGVRPDDDDGPISENQKDLSGLTILICHTP